jgi:hypothetical protein
MQEHVKDPRGILVDSSPTFDYSSCLNNNEKKKKKKNLMELSPS